MKRNGTHAKEANAERWLITYADLMNNLLIFFIMLYSISVTDMSKFKAFMNSFHIAYNGQVVDTTVHSKEIEGLFDTSDINSGMYLTSGDTSNTGSGGDLSEDPSEYKGGKIGSGVITPGGYSLENVDEFIKTVSEVIKEKGYQNDIVVERVDEYVYFRFTEGVLFYGDQAILKPTSYGPLALIGEVLKETNPQISNIEIAGHTQYVPNDEYKTDFSSWELSADRSITVLKYLVQNCSLPKTKMTIMGFSSTQPYSAGNTEEDRAKNRRVEIRIKKIVDDKKETVSGDTSSANSSSTASDTSH